jgi:hypothetical protein
MDLPAGQSAMTAAWHPNGTEMNVFYIGQDGQILNWFWDGSSWTDSALGNGEPAFPVDDLSAGSGMAAAWNPDGTVVIVSYIGFDSQIWQWFWDGNSWTNSTLGSGESAGQSGMAAAWHPDGTQANVFYVGTDSQVWNWYWNGSGWINRALLPAPRETAAGGMAAAWRPGGTEADVFYVGANGQIWDWFWNGSAWKNRALGTGEVAAGLGGRVVAAAWHPDGTEANVFYIGNDNQIWNWYWDGSSWTNSALGSGEPAAIFSGVAAAWHPDGTEANVFYVGNDGQIFNWFWNGSNWANGALGTGESAGQFTAAASAGSGPVAAWHPDGTEMNVFYIGQDGQIFNWFWNGSSWANSQL